MTAATRVEHDSMGALDVPANALWGAQTQRAIQNFPCTGLRMPRAFIRALGLIKDAAAGANAELGDLPRDLCAAIQAAALDVAAGRYDDQFPVDVFQTGSGTSSNMNANEVIATLASRLLSRRVHPNDHVNMAQSSNDVVPTAIHVAAALLLSEDLLPALERLRAVLGQRAADFGDVVKTGRTHLMDAMPVTLAHRQRRRPSAVGHAAVARARPGRHRGRHRHQRAAGVRRRVCGLSRPAHGTQVSAERQFLRSDVEPGHGRGTVRPAQGPWREPDENIE